MFSLVKLLLTLLAILTGLAGGDAVRAAPAPASAVATAIAFAEAASDVCVAAQGHRPPQIQPSRFVPDRGEAVPPVTAAPAQQDIPSYGLRTRE